MRKQKKVWEEEHKKSKAIPSLAADEPSSLVIKFVEFLKGKKITSGKVIDIGCGKGRNTVYLAKLGFDVYGMDYMQSALNATENLAIKNGLEDKVHLVNSELDEAWPFEDNYFDLAIDCFSSIDIETLNGRQIYRDEMLRTLKPPGYALISVVSINDELEREMEIGSEKNSTIWPNGKFQKNYSEEELREFYKEFTILELREVNKKAFKLNRNYTATNFWMVLRKPLD